MSKHEFKVGEYRTRGGNPAYVHFVVASPARFPKFPLIGERRADDGRWEQASWGLDGKYSDDGSETVYDLIPPVKYGWVNLHLGYHQITDAYASREASDRAAGISPSRVAVLRLELDENDRIKWNGHVIVERA